MHVPLPGGGMPQWGTELSLHLHLHLFQTYRFSNSGTSTKYGQFRTYGTKTALYSCSRHMTQRSGIKGSLLVVSDALSSFSFEPIKEHTL